MFTSRVLYALDDEGWDDARKRWAIAVSLPLVSSDATRAEASLPWEEREGWPAAVHEAAERLRRYVVKDEAEALRFRTGEQLIQNQQTRQDFVTVAPYSYNVALWADRVRLANICDRSLVIALSQDEHLHLAQAVGQERLVELERKIVASVRSDDTHTSAFYHHLESVGPREAQAFRDLASDDDPAVRAGVAINMPHHIDDENPDPDALQVLLRLTEDPDLRVRDYACFAIGTQLRDIDSPEVRDVLIARLDDIDAEARCEAMVGLAYRRDPRVLPAVREALSRANGHVWRLELTAAGALGDPTLHPLVLNHVDGWSDSDCSQTADVVRRLTDPNGPGEDLLTGVADFFKERADCGNEESGLNWLGVLNEALDIAPYRATDLQEEMRKHLTDDPDALNRFERWMQRGVT